MIDAIRRFVKEEDGVTFVEYALIVAVMVVIGFSAWNQLGSDVAGALSDAGDCLSGSC